MENNEKLSNFKQKAMKYWPLFCLIITVAIEALALSLHQESKGHRWMHNFMGLFLTQFAMFKFFNIKGFAEGFAKYDLLASRQKVYGVCYPFIEFLIGVGYLSYFAPWLIYLLTVIVFGFGAVGVIKALRDKLDVRCACMGTVLNVPLSTVTLAEDIIMFLMALFLLI
ncbi:MAG: hypothetical protein FJZ57_04940 [Chlamydiae bacterium]|nr:hypothetical protein [Chlamydiota bacterium]